MDPISQGLAGSLGLAVVIFGVILAILWVLVPFAVFGIKPLLRRLIGHMDAIERQNADVLVALRDLRTLQSPPPVVIRDERPLS